MQAWVQEGVSANVVPTTYWETFSIAPLGHLEDAVELYKIVSSIWGDAGKKVHNHDERGGPASNTTIIVSYPDYSHLCYTLTKRNSYAFTARFIQVLCANTPKSTNLHASLWFQICPKVTRGLFTQAFFYLARKES